MGKSFFAMALSHAAATGQPFLKWKPERAYKVLYLESEMTEDISQERFKFFDAASAVQINPIYWHLKSRDDNGHFPNVSTIEGQNEIAKEIERTEAELIILDNLLTSAPPIEKNDDDLRLWQKIEPFVCRIRLKARTILIIHHANKGGLQLGTIQREGLMNSIVRLTTPAIPIYKDKLEINLEFQKGRQMKPGFKGGIYCNFSEIAGVGTWYWQQLEDVRKAQIQKAAESVRSFHTLAKIFNCSYLDVCQAMESQDEFKDPTPDATFSNDIWAEDRQEDLDF